MGASFLLLLTGCASGPLADYLEAREACGLREGEVLQTTWSDTEFQTSPWAGLPVLHRGGLSEACVETIATKIGLDGASFDWEPHAMTTVEDNADLFVAGAFVLLAADFGTVGSLDESLDPQEMLRQQREDGLAGADLTNDSPAGAFWWWYFTSQVQSVRQESTSVFDGCIAELLDVEDGSVAVCPDYAPLADPSQMLRATPVSIASTLVHEAGHVSGLGHSCTQERGGWSCVDETPWGVYGLQARFLDSWQRHAEGHPEATDRDRWYAQARLNQICSLSIESAEGFQPCAGY